MLTIVEEKRSQFCRLYYNVLDYAAIVDLHGGGALTLERHTITPALHPCGLSVCTPLVQTSKGQRQTSNASI